MRAVQEYKRIPQMPQIMGQRDDIDWWVGDHAGRMIGMDVLHEKLRDQLKSLRDSVSVWGSGFQRPVRNPAARSAAAAQVLQPANALK